MVFVKENEIRVHSNYVVVKIFSHETYVYIIYFILLETKKENTDL